MFSNSAGLTRRPLTNTEYCICWPCGTGGRPRLPAGATTFCSRMTLAISDAVTPTRVARAEDANLSDAGHAAERVVEVEQRVVAEEDTVVTTIRRCERYDFQEIGR